MSFIYYCFYYNYYKATTVTSTKRVPKGFYATHSADVRITSFRMFNRIMDPLRINYRTNISYSDILYSDVRLITSFRMFYRIIYPLRINY